MGDPNASRELLQTPAWRWRLVDGGLVVELAGAVGDLPTQTDGAFGFASDRLRAAAAHAGQLYVATDAWLEIAPSAAALGALTAPRLAPIAADRLDDVAFVDGSHGLFSTTGAVVAPSPVAAATVPPVVRGRVTALGLNLRAGPSVAYDVRVVLPQGTEFVAPGWAADVNWWLIRLPDGTEGWVNGVFIEVDECETAPCVPVLAPAAAE